ncbi:hypothetical protein NCC49_005236 [Naganishia albida]|nr:hypothetical protein NCC49_005236 [Naganishia albida]
MDKMRFLITTLLILYATLTPAIALSNGIDRAYAAAPTLHAIVPRHIETRSYDTLRPSLTGQHPTVILPQCGYVQSVACAEAGIEVVFKDRESFDYAKDLWNGVADGEGELLFVTESMECCQADQGVYVYWLVKDLVFEDSCLKVAVKADEVDMDKECDEGVVKAVGNAGKAVVDTVAAPVRAAVTATAKQVFATAKSATKAIVRIATKVF